MSTYALHLLWVVPIIVLQWLIAAPILRRNLRAIAAPAFLVGTYYWLTDLVAVDAGIWGFDPDAVFGLHIAGLPIEEVAFFYLTALLVAQSIVMFLPDSERTADDASVRGHVTDCERPPR